MRPVRHIMGLPTSLDLSGGEADATERAFAWLWEADRRFSPLYNDSEVTRFDPAGTDSAEMREILGLYRTYARLSGGAFRARLPARRFDPPGIVRGWAAQRAADLRRAAGVREFCLNADRDSAAGGRTELPARELISLTVVTDDPTTAFALGRDGTAWAAAQPGCLVHAVDAERRVHRSAALSDLLVPPGTMTP